MISNWLNNVLSNPFGMVLAVLICTIPFVAIWFAVSKFTLSLNFLRNNILNRVTQIVGAVMISILNYIDKSSSDNRLVKFFEQSIPDYLFTPLTFVLMFCLLVTFLPDRKETSF